MAEHDDESSILLPRSVAETVIKTGQRLLDWIDTPPTEIPHDIDPVTHSMALEEDFRAALTLLKETIKKDK